MIKKLLTAAIVAVLTAGCAKDDSNETSKIEPTQMAKVTKENIVGVWRSGDYWVSFSESGYNSAFVSINGDERIDEGNYAIDGDTITVNNSSYDNITKYIVNEISSTAAKILMIYHYPNTGGRDATVSIPLSLEKSTERPCERDEGLNGKTFTYDDVLERYGNKVVTFSNTIYSEFHMIRCQPSEPNIYGRFDGWQYYVYLEPYIYHVITEGMYYPKVIQSIIRVGELKKSSNDFIEYVRTSR